MSSKTKIVVLKARELIYTGIFILLGILLILLLIFMFVPSHKSKKTKETSGYTQGVYSSPLKLGENELELSVTVKDGNKTLYSGTPTQLENTQAADDLLAVGQRRTLTMYFHFPEATGNSAQAKDLTFTLCADATQTKNNPQRLFD